MLRPVWMILVSCPSNPIIWPHLTAQMQTKKFRPPSPWNLLQRTETQRGGDFIFYLQGNMSETPWAILKKQVPAWYWSLNNSAVSRHLKPLALKVDHHQGLESIFKMVLMLELDLTNPWPLFVVQPLGLWCASDTRIVLTNLTYLAYCRAPTKSEPRYILFQ